MGQSDTPSKTFASRLREWLRQSPNTHLGEDGVRDIRSMVALVDRFIDGGLEYPLECDDFISWKHPVPNVEEFRNRIADLEPLFFSKEPSQRTQAVSRLLTERNAAAHIVDLPVRDSP